MKQAIDLHIHQGVQVIMLKIVILMLSVLTFASTAHAQTDVVGPSEQVIQNIPTIGPTTDIEMIEPVLEELPVVSEDKLSIMPPYQPAIYHFGQDHRYSIILRGNGEAVVYFRGAFTNETDEPMSTVKLGKPESVDLNQLSAYQISKKPYCASYNPDGSCPYYINPDYYDPYSYGGMSEYHKLDTQVSDESIDINLREAVLPGEQGAYLLFYRADGVADKSLAGGYDYEFVTFKVDDNIKMINVGLEGDPDWKFKGANTMVEYLSSLSGPTSMLGDLEKGSADSRNATFDSIVSSIGYGMITKTANGLAPMETMVIEGTYARNYFGLYYKELGLVSSILLVFLVIVALLTIKLYKDSKPSDTQTASRDNLKTMMVISNFLIPTVGVMYTISVFILFQFIGNVSYTLSMIYPLTIVMIMMVSFLFFFTVFVGSAVYFGVKKGVGWGFANILINLSIYLILMSIVIAVVFAFVGGGNQIMPYGVMDSAPRPM